MLLCSVLQVVSLKLAQPASLTLSLLHCKSYDYSAKE